MIHSLFANLAIIITFVFLGLQFLLKTYKFNNNPKLIILFIGLASGLSGSLLMFYSISIADKVLIDLKHIIIAISGLYGSYLSAIISSAIIATARLFIFGINSSSIIAFIGIILMGILFSYISSLNKSKAFKLILINSISAIYMLYSLSLNLGFTKTFMKAYSSFIIISFVTCILSYYVCEYLYKSYENYKQLSSYELIVNSSLDLICVHDSNCKIKYVSPSIKILLGFSSKEAIGKYACNLLHPEDVDYIKEQHAHLLETRNITTKAYRYKKKSGDYIWFESKIHALTNKDGAINGILTISRDVTARVKMEGELKKTNDRLIAILDNGGTGITIRDTNGKLIDSNNTYLNMLGYDNKKEVESFINFVPYEERTKDKELMNDLLSGKISSYRIEKRYIKKDGTTLWADAVVTLLPPDNSNGAPLVIGMMNDITSRKAFEEKLLTMESQLKKANEELKEKNKILTGLSFSDGLTGIANRRYFQVSLEKEWKRAQRTFKPLTLLMVDIDYFKAFNDTYGHVQGDECLKTIATTLSNTVNRSTDLVARLGGEEFAIILPDTNEVGGKIIADKLVQAIEELKIPNENSKALPYITISIGLCCEAPNLSSVFEDFIHHADIALYRAKAKGRNRTEVYTKALTSKDIIHEEFDLWRKIEGIAADK